MLKKLHQPGLIELGEEVAEIRVEYPVHLLLVDPDRQRIERIVWLAPGPEAVGEAANVLLVDGVEHLDHRPLDDLVLQRCDTERTLAPVGFRDVCPARRSRPVAPCVQPAVQVLEITLQVLAVCRPCNAVHSSCGLRAQCPVSLPQPCAIDTVQESGEPRISVPWCDCPHTVSPVRHALPGAVSRAWCAVRSSLVWR